MKLSSYLKFAKINANEFSKKIGVSAVAMHRYLNGRVPGPEIMPMIFKATKGKVQPNDFYELHK